MWLRLSISIIAVRRGVWGSASAVVWAVGNGNIVHWDGSAWSPSIWTGTGLRGVWGSASTDVWAVGDAGTILHWDGSAWSPVSSGTTNYLFGVWGSASTDVWAVGGGGTILHCDGRASSPITSATEDPVDVAGGGGS